MTDKHYQYIPIEKFIYKYDDAESIMKNLKIKDEEIAEIISITNDENKEEEQQLINKLRSKTLDTETDLKYLENIMISKKILTITI